MPRPSRTCAFGASTINKAARPTTHYQPAILKNFLTALENNFSSFLMLVPEKQLEGDKKHTPCY